MGCTSSKSASVSKSATTVNKIDNQEPDGEVVRRKSRPRFVSFDTKVQETWDKADVDKDGKMQYSEIKHVIHALNSHIPSRELKKRFKAFDENNDGVLSYSEFVKFWEDVQSLPPLQEKFDLATGGRDYMVADELRRFLEFTSFNTQQYSELECAKIIYKFEGASAEVLDNLTEEDDFSSIPRMCVNAFLRFLCDGQYNAIGDPAKVNKVYQDMSKPLSNYYISSSHNTYLSGNQLSSASTPDAIAHALIMGVRVIELDSWDGPNGPIVNHGHTLCKPTSFEECLRAINVNAFSTSEYPVIITIENHCSPEMKIKQAELLNEIFGEKLFKWKGRVSNANQEIDWSLGPEEWLSPEDLKGRIVIRDKPKKKHKKGAKTSTTQVFTKTAIEPVEAVSEPIIQTEDLEVELNEDEEEATSLDGVPKELLQVIYIKNVKLKSIHNKEERTLVYEKPTFATSSSIVESKMLKLTKPGYRAEALNEYSKSHLIRVYPSGKRVDSSNYDPTPAWNSGCQFVALNYQTSSLPVYLNQAKFSDNGGCGYVLKPLKLRDATIKWNARDTHASVPYTLTLDIISGHYLPKPAGSSDKSEVIDPYVVLNVSGVGRDTVKYQTKRVDDNGFNPVWNESFEMVIKEPELCNIVFQVYDHDALRDDFIAYSGVAAMALRPGYRVVPLIGIDGSHLDGSTLFVKVSWKPGIPKVMVH